MRLYFTSIKDYIFSIGIIFIFALVINIPHSHGETDKLKITTHDPNSKIVIDYANLTLLYKATVTRPRISSRVYAQKKRANVGSKISTSNSNPTRMEAARVFYHYIKEEELDYIHTLRLGMEALPQVIPLQSLNRNEQLAYWLNLYNITVYELVASRYPIKKLKKLRNGSRKKPFPMG